MNEYGHLIVMQSAICAWQWIMISDAANELPLMVEMQVTLVCNEGDNRA
jgi:hypothetical protein